jgi:fumarate reductase flavoprotein subunit
MKVLKTEVAVLGSGPAGLAAAITLGERGTEVIVIEKAAISGGTGNMAMGPFAAESRLQKEAGVQLTKAQAFKLHMEYTHWRVNAALVKKYIDKSGNTISWLEEMGVPWFEVETQFDGAYCTHHNVKNVAGFTGPGVGINLMKPMDARARQLGAGILLRTEALDLMKEGDRVTGVTARNSSGEEIKILSKAVIIGTGGFGYNAAMVKKYTKFVVDDTIFPMKIPGLTGEGIKMAWRAGAARSEMNMHLISSLKPPFNGRGGARDELAAFRQPNLMVNLLGKRFMNEEVLANTTFSGNAIFEQKDARGFIVFDSSIKRQYETHGTHFCDEAIVKNLDRNIQNVLDEGCDCIFVAGTVDELAQKTGIDPEGLKKSIDEYNKMCKVGEDYQMGKDKKYLLPIAEPPYYAGMHVPSAYGSLGGIKINDNTEVLDRKLNVIPGLYSVGTDANDINGESYVYIMPGGTLGFALNSGRIAGEQVAGYVRKL